MNLDAIRFRVILVVLGCCFSSTQVHAQSPTGEFLCRQPLNDYAEFKNVAVLWMHGDGSYAATDLSVAIPLISGQVKYNAETTTLEWSSGIWSTLLGHFVGESSGTSVIIVTTKKDPHGQTDGVLQCIRIGTDSSATQFVRSDLLVKR